MSFLIPTAYAAAADVPVPVTTATTGTATTPPVHETASFLSMAPMLVIFVLLMYFMLWRPQNKRAKDHQNLVSNLAAGDEVVTAGGIAGTVVKVVDQFVLVTIGENTQIKVQKQAISLVLPKGTLQTIE